MFGGLARQKPASHPGRRPLRFCVWAQTCLESGWRGQCQARFPSWRLWRAVLGHGSELQMPVALFLLPGARSLGSAPDLQSQGSGSGSKAAGGSPQEPAALPGWEPGLSGPPPRDLCPSLSRGAPGPQAQGSGVPPGLVPRPSSSPARCCSRVWGAQVISRPPAGSLPTGSRKEEDATLLGGCDCSWPRRPDKETCPSGEGVFDAHGKKFISRTKQRALQIVRATLQQRKKGQVQTRVVGTVRLCQGRN